MIAALGATVLFGGLAACSHGHHHRTGSMTDADMAQMREKLLDKAGRELSLDDSQQAKLGSPPDLARAQALTQRLPISIPHRWPAAAVVVTPAARRAPAH